MTPRRRTLGVLLVLAVAAGVTTGTVATAAPAQAASFPSWADVQAAKSSEAATQKTVDQLNASITGLQDQATKTGTAALIAGEKYSEAVTAEQAAKASVDELADATTAANLKARQSQQEVGQLVAQLSRTGGGDLTVSMLSGSKKADDLLYQLGAMSHLTGRTTSLLRQARQDANAVSSLHDQAAAAQGALTQKTQAASAALKQANTLASASENAVAAQQANATQLYSQIAYLKGTSADVEAQYYAGVAAAKDAAKAPTVSTAGGRTTPVAGAGSTGGTASSGGAATPTTSSAPAPAPTKTTTPVAPPVVAPPVTKPPVTTPPVTTPPVVTPPASSAAVNTAIAYAKAQVGKPYSLGAAGPSAYDCSGLMMASYSAAGVAIGSHDVRAQYNYLNARGKIVSLSSIKAGDILFYYDSAANSMYHDAMYLGGGLMVEAPKPGVNVRITAIRYTQLYAAGRPVG
ncbi:C40 family peptidase [Frondihabitans cladoniiphilus]|uniref:NlpC/P60 domain-containing protein n=1 Tax=Frondihabitans cladoniiphilus TaxID=715785 RepID=A0ABP8W039_9MICO